MPVQINEMHIKANIVEPGNEKTELKSPSSGKNELDKDAIIKECTEIILNIIGSKKER